MRWRVFRRDDSVRPCFSFGFISEAAKTEKVIGELSESESDSDSGDVEFLDDAYELFQARVPSGSESMCWGVGSTAR